MSGNCVPFTHKLLMTILFQDWFGNYEIIISDDSTNDDLYRFIEQFIKENKIPNNLIRYFHNGSRGKSSINLNNAISKADGTIIKPMFCDDYFIEAGTMKEMVKMVRDCQWGFIASEHAESGRARFNPTRATDLFSTDRGLLEGCNTYGCPSAMIFRKTDITFDENLIWLMDTEFYVRMQQRYGIPLCNTEDAVNIREWEGQQSKTACNGSVILWEREYVRNKYKEFVYA